jgi:hypothetical protein
VIEGKEEREKAVSSFILEPTMFKRKMMQDPKVKEEIRRKERGAPQKNRKNKKDAITEKVRRGGEI